MSVRRFRSGWILFLSMLCLHPLWGQSASAVDFALCINGSGSISTVDFSIQKEGIKVALQDPRIFPRNGSIGFTLIQYASGTTSVHVPYTIIDEESDIATIISQINGIQQISGSTNPGDGINTAMGVLNANGSSANRQIICLSTDGIPNSGVAPATAIANAKAGGLVLDQFGVIAIEDPPFAFQDDFEAVYSSLVFGGGDVLVVRNFTEFANVLGASCVAPNSELIGLEVIQTVQDWNNTVPLIENKPTLVRAHLQSLNEETSVSAARLIGKRNGVELPGSPLAALNAPFNVPAKATSENEIRSRRRQLSQSLNFEVPASWLSGTVEFELEPGGIECSESAGTDDDCKVTVFFNPSKELPMKYLRVKWADAGGAIQAPGPDFDKPLTNGLLSVFPISKINTEIGSITYSGTGAPDTPAELEVLLQQIERMRRTEDGYKSTFAGDRYYYGDIANISSAAGKARIGGYSGAGGAGTVTVENLVHAHEIGHNLSRTHSNYCTAQGGDGTFPTTHVSMNKATIGDMTGGTDDFVYGYNSQTKGILPPFPTDPAVGYDLMSYCTPLWISDFTYQNLLTEINNRTNTARATPTSPFYALVSGKVNAAGSLELLPIVKLSNLISVPVLPTSGANQLEVLDNNGNVLSSFAFDFDNLEAFGSDDEAIPTFDFLVPFESGASQIVVKQGTDTLASVLASANAPSVNVTFPNGGENLNGDAFDISWTASDPDGDALTYTIQFSPDGGITWQTLAVDWSSTTFQQELQSIPETNQGLIRVIASDGFLSSSDDSDGTFISPNNAPRINILSPGDNSTFAGVTSINFTCEANDVEDGTLAGNSISWTSNLDGFLGTGTSLSETADQLAVGTHQITATVTDKAGASTSEQISIRIFRIAPLNLQPEARFTVIPSIGPAPLQVDTDASTASDPDGTIVAYDWDFGDGTQAEGVQASHVYQTVGTYPIVLTVTDDMGAIDDTTIFVTVTDSMVGSMTITSFTLIDAITDQDLMELTDGDTIDITQTYTDRFNIRANVIPDTVGSIVFDLNGSITDENDAPYAVLGNIGSDYRGEQFALGSYTLVATPYTGLNGSGVAGVPQVIQFEIVEKPTEVIGLELYDATTDQLIGPLTDGDVLDLAQIGSQLSIKAVTSPDSVGSVQFRLLGDANEVSLDNYLPYVFPGDNQAGDFAAYSFTPGTYQAKATSWKHPNGKGMRGVEYTADFTVIASARAARPDSPPSNALTLYPNPTNGKLVLDWKGSANSPISLKIYSLLGQKVWDQTIREVEGNWSGTLHLETLPSGTYVLKFGQDGYQTSQFFQKN